MMKALSRSTVRIIALAGLLLATAMGFTQEPAAQQTTRAADNSKVNDHDQPPADQQKNGQSDLELTRQIRRSIVQDASLSTYAHNVKIISQDGKVTLKGPVRSDDEKQAIEAKAGAVAGKDNVISELSIVPTNNKYNIQPNLRRNLSWRGRTQQYLGSIRVMRASKAV